MVHRAAGKRKEIITKLMEINGVTLVKNDKNHLLESYMKIYI